MMDGLGRLERLLAEECECRDIVICLRCVALREGLVNAAPELTQVVRAADAYRAYEQEGPRRTYGGMELRNSLFTALAALARKLDGLTEEKP